MATRMPKYLRDHWVAHMQAQPFSWERERLNAKGKRSGVKDKSLVQGNLKPIELWEYVLPEEHLPEMCHYLHIQGKGKQVHSDVIGKFAWAMRKALKLDPIPKFDTEKLMVQPRLLHGVMEGCSLYGVGIKKDKFKEFPQYISPESKYGYYQEGL